MRQATAACGCRSPTPRRCSPGRGWARSSTSTTATAAAAIAYSAMPARDGTHCGKPSLMTADAPRERLIAALREHALVIGDVVLTSGRTAGYYVDAKRAILLPAGFRALGELLGEQGRELGATAVGGLTMGADPGACAALASGADVQAV